MARTGSFISCSHGDTSRDDVCAVRSPYMIPQRHLGGLGPDLFHQMNVGLAFRPAHPGMSSWQGHVTRMALGSPLPALHPYPVYWNTVTNGSPRFPTSKLPGTRPMLSVTNKQLIHSSPFANSSKPRHTDLPSARLAQTTVNEKSPTSGCDDDVRRKRKINQCCLPHRFCKTPTVRQSTTTNNTTTTINTVNTTTTTTNNAEKHTERETPNKCVKPPFFRPWSETESKHDHHKRSTAVEGQGSRAGTGSERELDCSLMANDR